MITMDGLEKIGTDRLTPGTGLERTSRGWRATAGRVEWTLDTELTPGWHTLRWRMRAGDRQWRRAELTIQAEDGSDLYETAVGWSRRMRQTRTFSAPGGAVRVHLTVLHATGEFEIPRLEIEPVRGPGLALAAIREKFRLLRSYNCLGRAVRRGGQMLLKGQFRTFGRKLFQGLSDSRTLPPSPTHIPLGDELGTIWRRHEYIPKLRIPEPTDAEQPAHDILPIIMPVNEEFQHYARMAVLSIRRQFDARWECFLVGSGSKDLLREVQRFTGQDPRIHVIWASDASGLDLPLARALAIMPADRVMVASPRFEWREDAIHAYRTDDSVFPIIPMDRIPEQMPADLSPASLAGWLGLPPARDGYLFDMHDPVPAARGDLIIAADLEGISGWGSVVDAVLRGLPGRNIRCWRHEKSRVRPELLPPSVVPDVRRRQRGDAQLAIAPPYMLDRYRPDRRTVLFTMWETDRIGREDVRRLNRCGLVIVPSAWNVETFRASGVSVPMAVVPLGFDSPTFAPSGDFPDICTLGTAGNLTVGGIRKNVQGVVDLFRRAFPKESDVCLRVKLSPDSAMVDIGGDPRIEVLRQRMSAAELAAWYRGISAFVNGSFGEGFGLHLIEAMGTGRPLITANYSGLTAYFRPDLGFPVEHRLLPVENEIYVGRWAVPDDAGIIQAMRAVYEKPERVRELGRLSATRAHEFSWARMVQELHETLIDHGFMN